MGRAHDGRGSDAREGDLAMRNLAAALMIATCTGPGCASRAPGATPVATQTATATATQATMAPKVPGCSSKRPCADPTTACMSPAADAQNCGPAGCREMALRCSSDADCGEGSACGKRPGDPWSMCAPRRCSADGDCGSRNVQCSAGQCTARACKEDSECNGYCLSGWCSSTEGICATTLPRP